ncbi:MAG: sigma factor-like helix-turn-helix DNA-binding protein [Candidatus Limnocylindrales bacterium]
MTDLPPWLVPLQRRIDEALSRGAWAASCACYERDGRAEFDTRTNGNVLATIRFQAPGETAVRQWRSSLGAALILAAGGARIETISCPDNEAIGWVATAVINMSWRLPAVPVRLRPIDRGRGWAAFCSDLRGVSALPLSRVRISAIGGRPMGEALSESFARTTIPRLRARMDAERRALGDDFPVTVAAAAAEVFNSPEGMAGTDDGLATLEWQVSSRGLAENDWGIVASSRAPASTIPSPDRWGRLDAAVQKQAQEDVFGTGVHSPRSIRSVVSLDKPVGTSDESPLLGELLPAELDLGPGLEIDDLLAAANLTDREREVFELQRLDGLKQAEIAERLGIAPGTVANLSAKAAKKVRAKLTAT